MKPKMQKRYIASIVAIASIMLCSVILYVSKVNEESGNYLTSIVLGGLYQTIPTTTITAQQEGTMYTYLSQNPSSQNAATENVLATDTGYKGLSTDKERQCYTLIKSGCDNILSTQNEKGHYEIKPIVTPGSSFTATQLKKILYAIQNDNPDIFWIASEFGYSYSGSDTYLYLYSIFSKAEQQNAIVDLSNKILDISSKIPPNSTPYESEIFLHDYIVDNCKYSVTTNNPKIFTSYGCLVENSAVCEGISKSMQILLSSAKIECRTVTGSRTFVSSDSTSTPSSEGHMWNVVKINDNWYHLDVTWDLDGSFQRYGYFNVTEDTIKKDHTINPQLSDISEASQYDPNIRYNLQLPSCTQKVDNYYEKTAVKISEFNQGTDNYVIQSLLNTTASKKEFFYLMAQGNLALEDALNKIFSNEDNKFSYWANSVNSRSQKSNQIGKIRCAVIPSQNVFAVQLIYNS